MVNTTTARLTSAMVSILPTEYKKTLASHARLFNRISVTDLVSLMMLVLLIIIGRQYWESAPIVVVAATTGSGE